ISIQVDDGDTIVISSFTLTVNSVNDPAGFTIGPNSTITEDSGPILLTGWATNISTGPANESSQAVTFLITGNTNPGLFSAGPAVASSGTLSFTPAPDANGSADITIVAQDNGGTASGGADTSAPQSFHIEVQ